MTTRATATSRTRLALEDLEGRLAPAVFTVTNTNNDGTGSLRQAITDANNTANTGGPDRIEFNIAGTGVQTVRPDQKLPNIVESVTIDGYTQPGASPNSLAVGNNAVLRVEINGANAGNANGLTIDASNVTIRGLVINGFEKGNSSGQGRGISAIGSANSNLVIVGNYIGVDPTGTTAVPNEDNGIFVLSVSNVRIGGTDPADRNVASGNGARGIFVNAPNAVIQGNYAGTNAAGTAAVPNNFEGVIVAANTGYQIGGTAVGAGNVISGNLFAGLTLNNVDNSVVQGNKIGVGADGTTPIGNGDAGLFISNQAGPNTNNLIGGAGSGAPNTIAFNETNGITMLDPNGTGNRFQQNKIFENGALGIDLINVFATDGPSANDTGDADTGANGFQNKAVLISAPIVSGTVRVGGSLNSIANETYRIELFSTPVSEANGGEGQIFLSAVEVTTDASGNANFQVIVNVPEGTIISSTTTRLSTNDTSEFSNNVTALTLQGGSISGAVFKDLNGDGTRQPGEPGLGGVLVFLDRNNNGAPDGEVSALTAPDGTYSLTTPVDGAFQLRAVAPAGATVTTTFVPVLLTGGTAFTGTNLGVAIPNPPPPPAPPAPPPVERFAVGAGGPAGLVLVFDAPTRQIVQVFQPFPGYTGGLSVATGELTGDRIPDVIVGTANGPFAAVKVFDGATGAEVFARALPLPFGLNVAAGDLDGDGTDEIVLGTATALPLVLALRASDGGLVASFLAFPVFGGVTVAAGDIDGNGRDEIIAGAASGLPLVLAFDPSGNSLASFLAFPVFGGVNVAAGDLDGDGTDEMIVGTATGVPLVSTFPVGARTASNTVLAFPGFGGARVGSADLDGDGRDDLLAGMGPGSGPFGFGFRGTDLSLLTGVVGVGDPLGGAFVG